MQINSRNNGASSYLQILTYTTPGYYNYITGNSTLTGDILMLAQNTGLSSRLTLCCPSTGSGSTTSQGCGVRITTNNVQINSNNVGASGPLATITTYGAITSNGAITSTGLITANGGITMGSNQNITLASTFTGPTSGQLGYTISTTFSSATAVSSGVTNIGSITIGVGYWLVNWCVSIGTSNPVNQPQLLEAYGGIFKTNNSVSNSIATDNTANTCFADVNSGSYLINNGGVKIVIQELVVIW